MVTAQPELQVSEVIHKIKANHCFLANMFRTIAIITWLLTHDKVDHNCEESKVWANTRVIDGEHN